MNKWLKESIVKHALFDLEKQGVCFNKREERVVRNTIICIIEEVEKEKE